MSGDDPEEHELEMVRRNRRVRFVTWGAVAVGSVFLYFFVYPIPLIYLDDADGFDIESKVPDWLYDGIGVTAFPLSWTMEQVPSYKTYIEWMILQVEK